MAGIRSGHDASAESRAVRRRRAHAAGRLARRAARDRAVEVRRAVRGGRAPVGAAELAVDDGGRAGLAPALDRALLVRGAVPGPPCRRAAVPGGARGRRHDGRRRPARAAPRRVRAAVRYLERDRRRPLTRRRRQTPGLHLRSGLAALDADPHGRGNRPPRRPPRHHPRTAGRPEGLLLSITVKLPSRRQFSQPTPSLSRSRSYTSVPTTSTGPLTYSGPLPLPPAQSTSLAMGTQAPA